MLHPAFRGTPGGRPFAFGIQRMIARRLKACGRPTLFALFRTRVEHVEWEGEGPAPMKVGDIGLAVADAWPDDQVANLIVTSFACRWGIVFDMTAAETRTAITSRLFEADEHGGARPIAELAFDDTNTELPAHVHEIVQQAARLTGVRCPWSGWSEMFETTDPVGALYILRTTGLCSEIEEGVGFDRDALLRDLDVMVDAAPGSGVAHALCAEMLRAAHRRGASPLHLVAWLRRTTARGGKPAVWDGLVEELEVAPSPG